MTPDIGAVFHGFKEKTRRGALIGKHEAPIREHRRELIAHQSSGENDQVAFATLPLK